MKKLVFNVIRGLAALSLLTERVSGSDAVTSQTADLPFPDCFVVSQTSDNRPATVCPTSVTSLISAQWGPPFTIEVDRVLITVVSCPIGTSFTVSEYQTTVTSTQAFATEIGTNNIPIYVGGGKPPSSSLVESAPQTGQPSVSVLTTSEGISFPPSESSVPFVPPRQSQESSVQSQGETSPISISETAATVITVEIASIGSDIFTRRSSEVVVGSATLQNGGSPVVFGEHTLSLESSALVDGSSTISFVQTSEIVNTHAISIVADGPPTDSSVLPSEPTKTSIGSSVQSTESRAQSADSSASSVSSDASIRSDEPQRSSAENSLTQEPVVPLPAPSGISSSIVSQLSISSVPPSGPIPGIGPIIISTGPTQTLTQTGPTLAIPGSEVTTTGLTLGSSLALPTADSSSSTSMKAGFLFPWIVVFPVVTDDKTITTTVSTDFSLPPLTLTTGSDLTISTTSDPAFTTNTVVTKTGSDNLPTLIPIIVGCPGCGCPSCGCATCGFALLGLPKPRVPGFPGSPKFPGLPEIPKLPNLPTFSNLPGGGGPLPNVQINLPPDICVILTLLEVPEACTPVTAPEGGNIPGGGPGTVPPPADGDPQSSMSSESSSSSSSSTVTGQPLGTPIVGPIDFADGLFHPEQIALIAASIIASEISAYGDIDSQLSLDTGGPTTFDTSTITSLSSSFNIDSLINPPLTLDSTSIPSSSTSEPPPPASSKAPPPPPENNVEGGTLDCASFKSPVTDSNSMRLEEAQRAIGTYCALLGDFPDTINFPPEGSGNGPGGPPGFKHTEQARGYNIDISISQTDQNVNCQAKDFFTTQDGKKSCNDQLSLILNDCDTKKGTSDFWKQGGVYKRGCFTWTLMRAK